MEPRIETTEDVALYLERHEKKEILRFVTVGSVDDGKSTLIGRLLHDTHAVYDDQVSAVKRASAMAGAEIDFSLFTDGLVAEREQGITIDVAYRYFTTATRKYIIADTPGHVQYTRNMATGASTASLAIILIDARLGVQTQSRRHAFIASLLGIRHLVVGVNKMDLEAWAEPVYESIRKEFSAFAAKLDFEAVTFIPMSALQGDNVAVRSERMPFYAGPTLLEHLEAVPVGGERVASPFRFPVQLVLRPSHTYRGYAAQIASGTVRPGDEIMVLPSKKKTKVVGIDAYGTELTEAFAPMSVALRLADEVDVSRGDMLVHPASPPRVEQRFEAMLVWMHERALDPTKTYLLKHTTQIVRAEIEEVEYVVDLETLGHTKPPDRASPLALNDIARVRVRARRPLFIDAYKADRITGSFILIDSLTNDTVAAGMIEPAAARAAAIGESRSERTQVSARERHERLGHSGAVLVLAPTDASRGAQLLATAFATERTLFDHGLLATVVDSALTAKVCLDAGIVAIVTGVTVEEVVAEGVPTELVLAIAPSSEDPEVAAAAIVPTALELTKPRA